MTWKRINVSENVFNDLKREKINIENAVNKKMSYNDVMKILLGHEKRMYIVPRKRRKSILLEEMKPVIHL